MKELAKLLKQPDTIIFVGSGVSVWSGLPSWGGMLANLADLLDDNGYASKSVRNEIDKGDFLLAASYGFHLLTPPQIGDFVKKSCKLGVAKPAEIHKKIVTLGPSCFITTNYDDLLEQAFREYRKDIYFKPTVSNRNLTEMAGISHARSKDFLFKPHGDAADTESIILTREQYRKLLPDGDRHLALKTLQLMMVSRPIVFIGFGLRDPDFLYIRDILSNLYQGSTRDHYAIMADIEDDEIAFWRNEYGIHLVNYDTVEKPDSYRDHSKLLALLDEIKITIDDQSDVSSNIIDFDSSATVLRLTRYASSLVNDYFGTDIFDVLISKSGKKENTIDWYHERDEFDNRYVSKLLNERKGKTLLLGTPGAGKSFSISRAVSDLAKLLQEECLKTDAVLNRTVVPVVADLKLYQGNLYKLLDDTLPDGLALDDLLNSFEARLFLDSFNEMPTKYFEDESYLSDFSSFINKYSNLDIVMSSRTGFGLPKLDFVEYRLENINKDFVVRYLEEQSINIDAKFEREMISYLRRPFFFKLFKNLPKIIELPVSPMKILAQHIKIIRSKFQKEFNTELDLFYPLSKIAFRCIDSGQETIQIRDIIGEFDTAILTQSESIISIDIVNWLISNSIIVPLKHGKLSFIHQSITEHIAAKELSSLVGKDSSLLNKIMEFNRWDQTLLLTTGFLSQEESQNFVGSIVNIDSGLATSAVKFVESNTDNLIKQILIKLYEMPVTDFDASHSISFALNELNISKVHLAELERFLERRGFIGGTAAKIMCEVLGDSVKDRMLHLFYINRDDYSFVANGLGPGLSQIIDDVDIQHFNEWCIELENEFVTEIYENKVEEPLVAFISGVVSALERRNIVKVQEVLAPKLSEGEVRLLAGEILGELASNDNSHEGLKIVLDLLLAGIKGAIYDLSSIIRFQESDVVIESLSSIIGKEHVHILIENTNKGNKWARECLQILSRLFVFIKELLLEESTKHHSLLSAAYKFIADPDEKINQDQIIIELSQFEPTEAVDLSPLIDFELDWQGFDQEFMRILEKRRLDLFHVISQGGYPVSVKGLISLETGAAEKWLPWLKELYEQEETAFPCNEVASVLTQYGKDEIVQGFIDEFNLPSSTYRQILHECVLPHISNLSVDDLSDAAISYLLAEFLIDDRIFNFSELLSEISSEQFVEDKLMPLRTSVDKELLPRVEGLIRSIGKRHGRRYL